MKIAFVCRTLNACGGIERATTLLANTLSRRGHRVYIISWLGSDGVPFFDIDSQIEVHYLAPGQDQTLTGLRSIRRFVLLRRLYRKIKPDAIIISGLYNSIVNVPAALGFNIISWEHFDIKRQHHSIVTRFSRWLSAHFSKYVVTPTIHDAGEYKRIYKAKATRAIPNALTLKVASPSSLQNKVVLSVGRLVRVKGYDLLLDAWSKFDHPDWTLRIVASGKLSQKLQTQVKEKQIKQVEFVPNTPHIIEHYQQSAIYALSSRSENFPLVLLEAMYMGLPCVSFDCGPGPREIIRHEESGLIVPPRDTTAMAQALQTLMIQPELRAQMGKAGRHLSQQYQMDHIVPQWEILLAEMQTSGKSQPLAGTQDVDPTKPTPPQGSSLS